MPMAVRLSKKQAEYWREPYHRWNIKCGATRSGKTYLDYYMIPRRIRQLKDRDGLVALIGNTRGTLRCNVIEPMQRIWSPSLVGDIRSDNTVYMFGERVFCFGADSVRQADRLRGASVKYCYGDELVTWSEDVFEMLKSRLDKPYSRFDGTCNPDGPSHWAKKFIDSGADIFYQQYSIFDNPFLDESVRDALCREHTGVFYKRYILGEWAIADGLIYSQFAEDEASYYVDASDVPKWEIGYISVGQDFGGNRSKHTFCATGISRDFRTVYVLAAEEHEAKGTSVEYVISALDAFCKRVRNEWGQIDCVFADSAEQTIINSERARLVWRIRNSIKCPIIDRIRAENILLSGKRIKLVRGRCESLAEALRTAVWDKKADRDERLDIPGTTNICPLDAFEYSFEYWIDKLIRSM